MGAILSSKKKIVITDNPTREAFPEIKSTHSLAAKHVTKDKWEKLCHIKTQTSGFTLAKAIACAIEFDDQHVGVYAGDADTYKVFSEVLDPVICEYHGLPANFSHTSDLDASKITGNINPDAPVISTRIRVGRNIEGYGLSPGITKSQRLDVEKLMKTAFGKLSGDLAGSYYPLLGMKETVRQKLVDDHFLFMSGDRNLKASGMERDWPEGRGIYHNDTKTFLVWVNEEDQLRIISMEKGGDVKGVFERLVRGIKGVGDSVSIESGKTFMLDRKFGYLHSCPTNLGTGMRASVHIDLPGWTKEGLPALKARCEQLSLQPRGTRGESGGKTGVTYDISNKHRLGYSEVQLVQTMIDGVNTLYSEDVALQAKRITVRNTNKEEDELGAGCTRNIILQFGADVIRLAFKIRFNETIASHGIKRFMSLDNKTTSQSVPVDNITTSQSVPVDNITTSQSVPVDNITTSQPFPEIRSTQSLAAKYVTKEKWEKLRDIKTKTSGFTLAKAIACAIEFDDQHVGVYAGDEDTYKDFAEVLDPVICEYHGLPASFSHTSDLDPTKIMGNIDPNAPVISTRIRVGRNIEGFGLSPGITKEQRLGVENLMKNAFGQLSDDLAGNYYPLLGMEETVRQKLVDDHFLFMSGDRNLRASGMERDWPEGRGIYHNDAKTFLVWVNEEDQLRIISMEKGGDVKGVFERLVRGIKEVGNSVSSESAKEFMLDTKFGFLHSCPTNLGTGMRASVHIDLPGWTKEGILSLKARCEQLSLQPRGTRGESGGQTGVTYDISNKHRLGYSEVQLVQTMIDGVNALYSEDVALQVKHNILEIQPFPEIRSTQSLAAKYVTKEKWEKLCYIKTKTSGFTLAKAIACAIEFDDQHVGVYAGDADTYKDFAEVLDPVICEYHGLPESFSHTSDLNASKITGNIDLNAPVISTRIRVGRNIEGFGLSPGITKEQRLGVESLMKNAFDKLSDDLAGKYYPLLGMEEEVRQKLVDDHFLFMSGDRNLEASGMERDWPEGRGIYHNDAKTFLVWVNEEDQLRIISMEKGGDVKGVFERLVRGIRAVGSSVADESGKSFMLDPTFGFLHSCPTNLGTGMRASVHIDLPGWTAEGLPALKSRCEELSLQPRGTRGESGGQTGVTYDISNKHRLGYSEVQLVQTMIDGVNTLYTEDVALQAKLGLSTEPIE